MAVATEERFDAVHQMVTQRVVAVDARTDLVLLREVFNANGDVAHD